MEDYEEYFKIASIYTNVYAEGNKKESNDLNLHLKKANSQNQNQSQIKNKSLFLNSTNNVLMSSSDNNNLVNQLEEDSNKVHFSLSDKNFNMMRKDSNLENTSMNIIFKPNLQTLPFLLRANSDEANNSFLPKFGSSYSVTHSVNKLTSSSNFPRSANATPQTQCLNNTPKNKKEEIKKWLSRI
jgi:hypothetical protein